MFKKFFERLSKPNAVSVERRDINFTGYSKSMEKYKKKPGNESFELPFVKERYDAIVNALKYTKHSKRRAELLKSKKIYDEMLLNKNK